MKNRKNIKKKGEQKLKNKPIPSSGRLKTFAETGKSFKKGDTK